MDGCIKVENAVKHGGGMKKRVRKSSTILKEQKEFCFGKKKSQKRSGKGTATKESW